MITDADVKKLKQVFATKDDLKAMEKRFDSKFASKDDLKLVKDDLKAMEARQDKKYASKDDLTRGLEETKTAVVKEVTDYLQNNVINFLSEHEIRLDRLEKTVGGFPPLAS